MKLYLPLRIPAIALSLLTFHFVCLNAHARLGGTQIPFPQKAKIGIYSAKQAIRPNTAGSIHRFESKNPVKNVQTAYRNNLHAVKNRERVKQGKDLHFNGNSWGSVPVLNQK
jgi:hypothetical protein